jgi:hypothetical protein
MARKRSSAPQVVSRGRLNLSLAVEVLSRLGAYAAYRREPISVVVARAVEAEMSASRFRVYSGIGGDKDGPTPPALTDGPGCPQERSTAPGARLAG